MARVTGPYHRSCALQKKLSVHHSRMGWEALWHRETAVSTGPHFRSILLGRSHGSGLPCFLLQAS